MSLKGNNFHHCHSVGVALVPQSVTNTSVNGAEIAEPFRTGRQLTFIIQGGAFAATVDGAMAVQGKRRDTGSWEAITEQDGTTALVVTATLLDDGGDLENGIVTATLPDYAFDAVTYASVRLRFTEGGNAAALIAASYVISDLYEIPSGATDDFFPAKVRP